MRARQMGVKTNRHHFKVLMEEESDPLFLTNITWIGDPKIVRRLRRCHWKIPPAHHILYITTCLDVTEGKLSHGISFISGESGLLPLFHENWSDQKYTEKRPEIA
mmetsp:Transcript_19437/g.34972  ORF Transcript_19437/g.34972 Transcript_19437/m.34972 type:complete len:105 (+) Transcript_19437:687-1001(+)